MGNDVLGAEIMYLSMPSGTSSPTKQEKNGRSGRMRLYVGEVINSQATQFPVAEANWSLHWREMFSYPSRNQVNSRGRGNEKS